MKQVTSNVYVENGFRGSNNGFVTTREGVVMIDAPYRPSDAVNWRQEVARRGEVRYLINTEPHQDHWTGNFLFPGVVVSHQGTRARMAEATVAEIREAVAAMDPQGLALMEGYQVKLPAIAFSERLTLVLGEHTFELIHLPGHTPSEIAVYVPEERTVFTGDNVFCRVQTFLHEANPDKWLESLRRIEELEVDVIVPGHGEVCDKSYLPEQAAYIREWVDAVKGAIAKGLNMEETAASLAYFRNRYPFDVGAEELAEVLIQWNVENLYPLLKG